MRNTREELIIDAYRRFAFLCKVSVSTRVPVLLHRAPCYSINRHPLVQHDRLWSAHNLGKLARVHLRGWTRGRVGAAIVCADEHNRGTKEQREGRTEEVFVRVQGRYTCRATTRNHDQHAPRSTRNADRHTYRHQHATHDPHARANDTQASPEQRHTRKPDNSYTLNTDNVRSKGNPRTTSRVDPNPEPEPTNQPINQPTNRSHTDIVCARAELGVEREGEGAGHGAGGERGPDPVAVRREEPHAGVLGRGERHDREPRRRVQPAGETRGREGQGGVMEGDRAAERGGRGGAIQSTAPWDVCIWIADITRLRGRLCLVVIFLGVRRPGAFVVGGEGEEGGGRGGELDVLCGASCPRVQLLIMCVRREACLHATSLVRAVQSPSASCMGSRESRASKRHGLCMARVSGYRSGRQHSPASSCLGLREQDKQPLLPYCTLHYLYSARGGTAGDLSVRFLR